MSVFESLLMGRPENQELDLIEEGSASYMPTKSVKAQTHSSTSCRLEIAFSWNHRRTQTSVTQIRGAARSVDPISSGQTFATGKIKLLTTLTTTS